MASSNVKSAARLMSVLELLARQARPVPTMTIARECSIPKSSAHHLLNEMRSRDFVTYYEVERAWGVVERQLARPDAVKVLVRP